MFDIQAQKYVWEKVFQILNIDLNLTLTKNVSNLEKKYIFFCFVLKEKEYTKRCRQIS